MSKRDDLYTMCEIELEGFLEQAFPDAQHAQRQDIRMIWRAGQYIAMNQLAERGDDINESEVYDFMNNLQGHLQSHS